MQRSHWFLCCHGICSSSVCVCVCVSSWVCRLHVFMWTAGRSPPLFSYCDCTSVCVCVCVCDACLVTCQYYCVQVNSLHYKHNEAIKAAVCQSVERNLPSHRITLNNVVLHVRFTQHYIIFLLFLSLLNERIHAHIIHVFYLTYVSRIGSRSSFILHFS